MLTLIGAGLGWAGLCNGLVLSALGLDSGCIWLWEVYFVEFCPASFFYFFVICLLLLCLKYVLH